MDPNIAALAATAATALAPALPYLMKAGEAATSEQGQKTLGVLWEKASAVWNLIKPKADASPALAEALQDVERNPTDADSLAVLRVQIRKLLEADPELVTRVRPLVESNSTSTTQTVVGNENLTVGGNISGSTVTYGQRPPGKPE